MDRHGLAGTEKEKQVFECEIYICHSVGVDDSGVLGRDAACAETEHVLTFRRNDTPLSSKKLTLKMKAPLFSETSGMFS